jgi:hypothetical protein
MTSFERMRSALSFSEPDRVPFDLCGTTVTGISRTKLLELLADEGFEQSCTIAGFPGLDRSRHLPGGPGPDRR